MPVLELGPDPAEVPAARHWVLRRCEEDGVEEDVRDVVELLTSELVANAYQHGRPPVRIRVSVVVVAADSATGRVVRLELEGPHMGPGAPVVRDMGGDALGGRGMALVDMLAAAWGVRPAASPGTGKTVWCRLAA